LALCSAFEVLAVTETLFLMVAFVLGAVARSFFGSYGAEKGKNLATREDVAEITRRVEAVRTEFHSQSSVLEMRRRLYERVADSLRIFTAGHQAGREEREAFLSAYSACWLWAPDEVIGLLNSFLDMQKRVVAEPGTVSEAEMKEVYGRILLAMRKDAGFSGSELSAGDFSFVRF
jgi:hypothetical protein